MKIALISCSKSKQNYSCKVSEMYQPSTLFHYSYLYAKKHDYEVYVLSAKYGLIHENVIIEPYDLTLKNISASEKRSWSQKVIQQLKGKFNFESDEFIILAGRDYCENLLHSLKNHQLPLGNKPLGERVKYLKNEIQNNMNENCCLMLHELFNSAQRYSYNEINNIPFNNGIYVVFEKGEKYKGLERIVRIGTHDSDDRLKLRLKDHFLRKNKDGSIFRKNIGKALLNKGNDSYLKIWTLDSSKPDNKKLINSEKQKMIEDSVSEYLQNDFSFTCFRVDDKKLRLRLEKGLISTLNSHKDFYSSEDWLGQYSPVDKIKKSGLWLTIGLEAPKLTDEEFELVRSSVLGKEIFVDDKRLGRSEPKESINLSNVSKRKSIKKDTEAYILSLFNEAQDNGEKEIILVSREIHKAMGLINSMPSVCNAMYSIMNENDEVLMTTPSGKSSTIKIKYYLGT